MLSDFCKSIRDSLLVDVSIYRTQPALSRDKLVKKPNYSFEKRQREVAKEKKREAKRLKKLGRTEQDEKEGTN